MSTRFQAMWAGVNVVRERDLFPAAGKLPLKTTRRSGEFHFFDRKKHPKGCFLFVERVKGLEPSISAWKANVLPLHYTRMLKFR